MRDMLIERVQLAHEAPPVDLLIQAGSIARIEPAGVIDAGAAVREDGTGALALPGMVDAHCHVDKTLWGRGWVPHSAGPVLEDRIANGERGRAELGLPSRDGVRALLGQMAAAGTTLAARTPTSIPTSGCTDSSSSRRPPTSWPT